MVSAEPHGQRAFLQHRTAGQHRLLQRVPRHAAGQTGQVCFLFTALSFVSRAFSFCSPRFSLQCLYCEKTFRDKTTLKEKSSPPHQRQKPRVRPLLRHQLPGKAQRHTRHTLPRQDKRSSSVEANARPECIVPILKRPSCPVRNWEKRGRSCKAKMTVSWRMMRMSKYPHVAL